MLRRFAASFALRLYYVLENYPALVHVAIVFVIATSLWLFVAIGLPLVGPGWLLSVFFVGVIMWAAVKDARRPKKSLAEVEDELSEIVRRGRE